MSDSDALSDEERAELEQLRAEKAQRQQAEKNRRERAELERLKSEHAQQLRDEQEDERIRARRQQGERAMEPDEDDEDVRMPRGQKIVLVAIFAVALAIILVTFLGK